MSIGFAHWSLSMRNDSLRVLLKAYIPLLNFSSGNEEIKRLEINRNTKEPATKCMEKHRLVQPSGSAIRGNFQDFAKI